MTVDSVFIFLNGLIKMDTDFNDLGYLLEGGLLEQDTEEATEEPTLTFKVENGRIRGKTDERDAMEQALEKVLLTERFVYPIYDDQYGNDLLELVGKDMEYAQADVERIIVEALTADDRVLEVTVDEIEVLASDILGVKAMANTVYGTFNIEREVKLVNES